MLARAALAAAAVLALALPPATADVAGPPLQTWIPDGEVKALAVSGQTAYVGGTFGRIAPYTGGSVRLDPSTAAAKAPWADVQGTVNAVVSDGAGGVYLGGDFAGVGGVPRQNLAHVLANGTLDPNWTPSTNGIVRALALGGGLYVGGSFTAVNGVARNNLAALASDGSLTSANFGVTNASDQFCTGGDSVPGVQSLALSGSTLYVGGIFDTAHASTSVTRNSVAAFSLSGSPAVTGFDPNLKSGTRQQPVYGIQVDGSGVYIGGCFLSVAGGGVSRSGVAKLNATTGAADVNWNSGLCCGAQVETIALAPNRLYVSALGLPNSRDLIALNLVDGQADSSFDPPMHDTSGVVETIHPTGSLVYAGGRFKTDALAPQRTNLVALNTAGAVQSWAPDGAGSVRALGMAGADVVAGGRFETYGGVRRRNLAAIDLTTGMPTAFTAPISDNLAGFSFVGSLALGDGVLWAAGPFETTGANPLVGLAAFDPVTGAQTTFNKSANSDVRSLAASGSSVYIGGLFTQVGGVQRRGVAHIRHVPGDQGEVQRFDADVNGEARALALAGDTLYIGGLFDKVNTTGVGAVRSNLAAVNSDSGDVLPFDPNADGLVRALALADGTLFAGGDFAKVGGADRLRLTAIERSSGLVRTWRADADASVFALAAHGRTLFAGGAFTQVAGASRAGIAALDADSAAVLDWPLQLAANPVSGASYPAPQFNALAAGPSTGLLAGGDFHLTTAALRSIHFSAFRLPPSAPPAPAALAGDGQATVEFTPPPGDGGSPVTSYTVVASPGGQTASGAVGPLTVSGLENGTTYTFTATAANAVGAGPPSGPSNAVTPIAPLGGDPPPGDGPPAGPPATDPAPRLERFSTSRRRFAVGKRRTPATGVAKPAATERRRTPRGTKLRVRLSEAASVKFVVLRRTTGRRVGGVCRRTTRANRRRTKCTLLVRRGSFTRMAPVGRSKVAFSGRIRKRALRRGPYTMRATPKDAGGNTGARRSLRFRIVR